MSKRIALFPGSFDPITFGHIEIVKRGLAVFDEIVVGLGTNTTKKTMFTQEQRQRWIEQAFADDERVKISVFSGLTVRFAHEVGAQFLLRGLRDQTDFVYEKNINFLNKHLEEGIETVFLVSDPVSQTISSSLVREIIHFEGKLEGLIPEFIIDEIYT